MMPPLPVLSGRQARAAFERLGWVFRRQNGSHMILSKSGQPEKLSVPDHRELRPGTLRSLIRLAGITVEEFVRLLD
ncbi:type II toxin-antitoxin system HicA family toxin [bacterium]|nr:type II toxin-antitoxin system HicA family toxin [bacterium]